MKYELIVSNTYKGLFDETGYYNTVIYFDDFNEINKVREILENKNVYTALITGDFDNE